MEYSRGLFLALVVFFIGIGVFVMMSNDIATGLFVMFLGILGSFLTCLLLAAIGQAVESLRIIAISTHAMAGEPLDDDEPAE